MRLLHRILFIVIVLCLSLSIVSVVSFAQDAPPAGHLDSCEATPAMYAIFGPHCLNPVTWNLPDFYAIGTTAHFVLPNGETDMGQVAGYSWQPIGGRYHYYLMTQMPHERFAGAFTTVAPEAIIRVGA
jgi:hypothetical protein